MKIKFRSGFISVVIWIGIIAALFGAMCLLWSFWDTAIELGKFTLYSVCNTALNMAIILAVLYGVLQGLPWLASKYVVQGFTYPKVPKTWLKYALGVTLGLGLALIPLNMNFHTTIVPAVAPIAKEFQRRAFCNDYSCHGASDVIKERDEFLAANGGQIMWGNQWWVSNASGTGSRTNTDAIYVWKPWFFLF